MLLICMFAWPVFFRQRTIASHPRFKLITNKFTVELRNWSEREAETLFTFILNICYALEQSDQMSCQPRAGNWNHLCYVDW